MTTHEPRQDLAPGTCLLDSDVAELARQRPFVRAAYIGGGVGLPGRPASRAADNGGRR